MNKTFMLVVMAVLGLSSIGSSAMAADEVFQAVKARSEFSFYIDGHTGWGNEVYYSCRSVEGYAENMLKKMGATNINVSCTGGIDDFGYYSIMPSVTVSFDSIRLPGANITGAQVAAVWTDVKLHDFDNCHLAKQIIDGVKDHFDIRNLKTGHCSEPNDSYQIEMSALMAK